MLIVLGMLSFMVVSAVAFSIFMRQNRLPSSFLRQRILARQLVKAGLSHAMSDIDTAIGDDPYPNEYRSVQSTGGGGIPGENASGQNSSAVRKYLSEISPDLFQPENHGYNGNRNYWRNRVFMGVYGEGYADGSGGASSNTGGIGGNTPGGNTDSGESTHLKNTVATFPLEGLAYIPPPLVNTVRYWARRSPAATWKNLDYDSGRYAFTAVNVSDYFDINRLKANVMRDSSPDHRISLGYLFEDNATHASWGSVKPSQFDAAMNALLPSQSGSGGSGTSQSAGSDGFGRLVSIADYNMAISADLGGPLKACGFLSQFCEFIKNPPSGAEFYTNEDQARTQKFVTDSWYPGSASEAGDLILYNYEQPPFRSTGKGIADIPAGISPLMSNAGTVSPVYNEIKDHFNLAERAALKDYVDRDNVPTSLALPTIERTPQIVGLMARPFNFQPKITELEKVSEQPYGGDQKKRATKRVWKLEGFQQNPQVAVQVAGVFPFKRTSGLDNATFPVQVLVKAYLVESGRTFNETRTKNDKFKKYRPAAVADWRADNGLGSDAVGYVSLFGTGNASVSPGKSEQDALKVNIPLITCNAANVADFARPLFGWITVEQQDEEGNWAQIPGEDGAHYDTSRFGECGNGSLYYLNDQGQFVAAGEGSSLKWQYFIWVRILDSSNNTVDLFPATIPDDQVYNGVNAGLEAGLTALGDSQYAPIVPIAGPAAFQLDQETFLGTQNGHASGDGDPGETLAGYCNDPRYNWAPEDWWFVSGASGVTAQEWYDKTTSYRDGSDYRQNDLYQFVSNQGYLQSMGEIQFLPLVRRNYNDGGIGQSASGRFFRQGSQYDGVKRTAPGDAANQELLWKSRFAFGDFSDHSQGETHCPYAWGILDRLGGVAVNPYSDPDLLAAALANTPYDYIVAAEQENDDDKKLEDNIDLCFNARSSEAPLTWEQLRTISSTLQEKILAKSGDWEENWEDSDEWDADDFFGVSLTDFHDVDRKFLYSYWKQCFGNNQQLFLIFVRAEPTVIGGSSAGHTPSQLGARAVALVWRDPVAVGGTQGQSGGATGVIGGNTSSSGSSSSGVHKMRVLFYHQFE